MGMRPREYFPGGGQRNRGSEAESRKGDCQSQAPPPFPVGQEKAASQDPAGGGVEQVCVCAELDQGFWLVCRSCGLEVKVWEPVSGLGKVR